MSKLWKTNWFRPVFFIALALGLIVVVVVLTHPERKEELDIADSSIMQTPENTVIAALQDDELTELNESGVDGAGITETESVLDEDYDKIDDVDEEIAEEDGSGSEELEENTADSDINENSDDTSNTEENTANSNDNKNSGGTSDAEENTADPDVNENSNDGSNTEENEASDTAELSGDDVLSGEVDTSDIEDQDSIATYKDPDHEEDDPPEVVGAKWVNGEAVPMTVAEVDEFLRQIYACETKEEFEALMDTVAYFNVGLDVSKFLWYEGE